MNQQHRDTIELAVHDILEAIGEDPGREGLMETPSRIGRMYEEIFGGYFQNPKDVLNASFESDGYDEMVLLRDCEFYSTCEHHMVPFFGRVHIAYIPGERVVGISKLARLVDVYARRLQIQERMTRQIADALDKYVKPEGVGVVVEAQHLCMLSRGVKKFNSTMVTSSLIGNFEQGNTRAEFMKLIARG